MQPDRPIVPLLPGEDDLTALAIAPGIQDHTAIDALYPLRPHTAAQRAALALVWARSDAPHPPSLDLDAEARQHLTRLLARLEFQELPTLVRLQAITGVFPVDDSHHPVWAPPTATLPLTPPVLRLACQLPDAHPARAALLHTLQGELDALGLRHWVFSDLPRSPPVALWRICVAACLRHFESHDDLVFRDYIDAMEELSQAIPYAGSDDMALSFHWITRTLILRGRVHPSTWRVLAWWMSPEGECNPELQRDAHTLYALLCIEPPSIITAASVSVDFQGEVPTCAELLRLCRRHPHLLGLRAMSRAWGLRSFPRCVESPRATFRFAPDGLWLVSPDAPALHVKSPLYASRMRLLVSLPGQALKLHSASNTLTLHAFTTTQAWFTYVHLDELPILLHQLTTPWCTAWVDSVTPSWRRVELRALAPLLLSSAPPDPEALCDLLTRDPGAPTLFDRWMPQGALHAYLAELIFRSVLCGDREPCRRLFPVLRCRGQACSLILGVQNSQVFWQAPSPRGFFALGVGVGFLWQGIGLEARPSWRLGLEAPGAGWLWYHVEGDLRKLGPPGRLHQLDRTKSPEILFIDLYVT